MDLLVHMGAKERHHLSLYWFNQLLNVLKKQKFNPLMLSKLLKKLHVIPHSEPANSYLGLHRYQQS